MANFVKHQPCKHCGSRDNAALYDDGSMYCFGCHAYTKGSGQPGEPKPKEAKKLILVKELPKANKDWLLQYLSEEQIEEFFQYSRELDRHVYTENYQDAEGKDRVFWEARKVPAIQPKTISSGEKPFKLHGKWKETGTVVIVEDIVSAIKLADFVGVLCLHGSVINYKVYDMIGKIHLIKNVILWMDIDKLSEADVYQRKFLLYSKKCSVVSTPKDPKSYDKDEILEILGDAL